MNYYVQNIYSMTKYCVKMGKGRSRNDCTGCLPSGGCEFMFFVKVTLYFFEISVTDHQINS